MIGGWRWISGMAMNHKTPPTEFRCPSCGGIAQGYRARRLHIRDVKPEDIRAELGDFPFELEVVEWADGKGVNVTMFPEVLEKHERDEKEGRMSSPYVLLCDECHTRSDGGGRYRPERYWQIRTRHGVLWADNREHLVEIRDHVQLERRPQGFIKLPGWVLAAKNRDEIVKLINRALEQEN